METKEQTYRYLRELRDHLSAETGRYGKISDGEIVMMSPVPQRGLTAKRIVRQVDAQLPEPLAAFENADTDDERLGKLRIPDIVVVPEEATNRTSALDPREITRGLSHEPACLTFGGDRGCRYPRRMRWRRRVKPARPCICRAIRLVLVLTPSVGPLLYGSVNAAITELLQNGYRSSGGGC